MDHVFMVLLDWSTTDEDGFQIELFKNYDDAYDRFKEIISEQLKEFWDGEVDFDIDGDPGEEYEFSEEDNNSGESEVYWHLSYKHDYSPSSLLLQGCFRSFPPFSVLSCPAVPLRFHFIRKASLL